MINYLRKIWITYHKTKSVNEGNARGAGFELTILTHIKIYKWSHAKFDGRPRPSQAETIIS